MKTSNRVLLGFGGAIAGLIILTVILVFTLGKSSAPLLPADTPEGVVQRYLLAVQDKDYHGAYAYLSPAESWTNFPKDYTPTYDDWLMSARFSADSTWKASLVETVFSGDTASVQVSIDVFQSQGPLGNPIRTNNTTFMLKKAGEQWLIQSPTDLYWLY